MSQPAIRRLDDGSMVVDFGSKWFRRKPNGMVIARVSGSGSVRSRPATPAETKLVYDALATSEVQECRSS